MKTLSFSIPKNISATSLLLLIYFALAPADELNIFIWIYKVKLTHIISLLTFTFFFSHHPVYLSRKIFYGVVLLFGSMLVSSFQSPYFVRSIGYLGVYLIEFFFYFLLPYNCIYQLNETRVFKIYMISFVLVGAHAFFQLFFSVFGIYIPKVRDFIFHTKSRFPLVRPSAFTYEPSYYALYMTSYAAFWNALCLVGHSFSKKVIYRNMFIANMLLLISTSAGVILQYGFFVLFVLISLIIAKDYMVLKPIWKKLLMTLGIFTSIFVAMTLIAGGFMQSYLLKSIAVGIKHPSFVIRWKGIVNAWQTFISHPILGVGYGGVGPYMYELKHGKGSVLSAAFDDWELLDPTNVFTEILASLGIVGLLCFVYVAGLFCKDFLRVLRLPQLFQKEKEICLALFISLATLIFVLQFNQGIFRNYIWIHGAICLGYFHKLLDRNHIIEKE